MKSISFRKNLNKNSLGGLVFAVVSILTPASLYAQDIYVSDLYGNSISEYTLSGTPVATPLASGSDLGNPFGMAVSGDTLYVANYGADTISEYNANTGAEIGTNPFISGVGLNQPADLLLNGDDLYVANIGGSSTPNNGSVYEFNALTGAMIGTGPLISSGLNYSEYMALAGNDLYVSSWTSVNVYNATTGAEVGGAPLISGLDNVRGLAVNGNDLYVVDGVDGTVTEYNATTGKEIGHKPLISGLEDPRQIVYLDGDIYVSDVGTNSITEYDATTGKEISCTPLVGGASNPYDFIITSDPATPVPEPSTWAMLLGGLLLFIYIRRARSR